MEVMHATAARTAPAAAAAAAATDEQDVLPQRDARVHVYVRHPTVSREDATMDGRREVQPTQGTVFVQLRLITRPTFAPQAVLCGFA